MSSSLWNGFSGISNYSKSISVESNNLANSNTTGHKSDDITFSDVLYTSGGYGKGLSTQSISKNFSQGSIATTSSNLDVAIKGSGFFVVKDNNGSIYYTRAGDFYKSKDGFLKTQDGMNLLGLLPQSKKVVSSDSSTMFTRDYTNTIASATIKNKDGTVSNINAKTTDYSKTVTADSASKKGNNYKTAQSKIKDINALINNYINVLKNYNSSSPSVASTSQTSSIDFLSQISNLKDKNNNITVTIDGKTFSVNFDKSTASSTDMTSIYNSLSDSEKTLYKLIDPSTIPTQKEIDNLKSLIPDQSTIDSMPTTTPEEIEAKNQAQKQRDTALNNYKTALELKDNQQAAYDTVKNTITPYKDLADRISTETGFAASVKDGKLIIENLIPGQSFVLTNVRLNSTNFRSETTQEAVKGSGDAMVDSARRALKEAVENVGGKFLEITNVMQYSDLSTYGASDLNVNLKNLGLSDDELGSVSISNDGFVFVTSGDNKFLVGKISTAGFRNDQGLQAVGNNKYQATDASGNPFNADALNTLQSYSLEKSNVDYATTLSSLMVHQRAFEANSKIITTSDEFLKTAIDMIK